MTPRTAARFVIFPVFLFALISGCATPPLREPLEPPPFPDRWMNSSWGDSVEEVRRAIEKDGNRVFQDSTEKPPYALYVSGAYLGEPAVMSYFFTPKSKKLYRVDVTYHDPAIYEKIRVELVQRFKAPSQTEKNVSYWGWRDHSLIILQKEPLFFQVGYLNGTFSKLNHEEGGGAPGK